MSETQVEGGCLALSLNMSGDSEAEEEKGLVNKQGYAGQFSGRSNRLSELYGASRHAISSGVPSSSESSDESGTRHCWICYASESVDEVEDDWRSPCECRGTSRWVHEVCLLKWIDEKQKGHSLDSPVHCPKCKFKYRLHLPPGTRLEHCLQQIKSFSSEISPMAVVGVIGGALLCCSYKYGGLCLSLILGENTDQFLSTNSWFHNMVLQTLLPIGLIGIGGWHLETWVAKGVSLFTQAIGTLSAGLVARNDLSAAGEDALERQRALPPPPEQAGPVEIVIDHRAVSRFLVRSLSLPLMASFFGLVFFRNLNHNHSRKTLCGGLLYIALKGAARFYKQSSFEARRRQRTIADWVSGPASSTA